MSKMVINKWFTMKNPGSEEFVQTHDSWEIPEGGTVIASNGWKKCRVIEPYGDGIHVIMDGDDGTKEVYKVDQLFAILDELESKGYSWYMDGVEMKRKQLIDGKWAMWEVTIGK